MKLNFRIDWGYHFLYSNDHFHPQMHWDGALTLEGGTIQESYKLEYPRPNPDIVFGPGQSAKETPLEAPQWESATCNWFEGVRIIAEANEDAVFHLQAGEFTADFKAAELLQQGRLTFPCGPKYLNCAIDVTLTDYLWFRPAPKAEETEISIYALGLPVYDWARMKLAWLSPEQPARWEQALPQATEHLLHLAAMAVPLCFSESETEQQVQGRYTFGLYCDGALIKEFSRNFRHHDADMQMLEDEWVRFTAPAGNHQFELKIHSAKGDMGRARLPIETASLGISLLRYKPCHYAHGQLSLPQWALKGETVFGKVYAEKEGVLEVNEQPIDCQKGWNEFPLDTAAAGSIPYRCGAQTATIEIYDIPEEQIPIKVGFDMTTIPHTDDGFLDWLLDYTARTRLGNYIMFRNFTPPTGEESYRRWAKFCREHHIYASTCRDTYQAAFPQEMGEFLADQGKHEYAGRTYIGDPQEPYRSKTMKEAAEHFTAYMKEEIDKTRQYAPRVAFGDPSGAVKYSFMAGADSVRAETLAGATAPLLASARACAESLGKGEWGVHVAIQHNHQLYHENHLGIYFLGLMQPWVMGAQTIYEEDSLFSLFKEERQGWDDALTKGKRDMTRRFFHFAKTHPRGGKCIRNIAIIDGRYSISPLGAVCFKHQDHRSKVWGMFGKEHPTWEYRQPEKSLHIYDVLMPGNTLIPLHQKPELRRFFFTGTPYGDFDKAPIEASLDYLKQYKLLVHLGWNTTLPEDPEKLSAYVQNGGCIFAGLPQFSTHEGREFLEQMEDLALINGGDLSALCGFKVLGKGQKFSGQWKTALPLPCPTLSALPNESPEEDGEAYLAEIELTSGEVLAWDQQTKQPLLIRNRCGNGYIYTLTFYAYAGHEKAQPFAAACLAYLAEQAQGEIRVCDPSNETFWSVWEQDGTQTLYLLNTDWTTKGNTKEITVYYKDQALPLTITERELTKITFQDGIKVETFTI